MSSSDLSNLSIGVYQHFKGAYYFVSNITKLCSSNDDLYNTQLAGYFNLFHPEYGVFSRPLSEFLDDVVERKDNVTGQKHRFERITDFPLNPVSKFDTGVLIEELRKRTDSPIHDLDIDGLQSEITVSEYVIGRPMYNKKGKCLGVSDVIPFDNRIECEMYYNDHKLGCKNRLPVGMKKFKRVYREVK